MHVAIINHKDARAFAHAFQLALFLVDSLLSPCNHLQLAAGIKNIIYLLRIQNKCWAEAKTVGPKTNKTILHYYDIFLRFLAFVFLSGWNHTLFELHKLTAGKNYEFRIRRS
jgi:hypothetical protein